MPVESWLNPDEVPDFAAHATAMIDAALTGSGLTRDVLLGGRPQGLQHPLQRSAPQGGRPRARRAGPAERDPVARRPAVEPIAVPAAVIAARAAEARAL